MKFMLYSTRTGKTLSRTMSAQYGGASTALEVKISSSATPIPKQWNEYISNCKNKTNLCQLVSTLLCQEGQEKLPENKKIVIAGVLKMEKER